MEILCYHLVGSVLIQASHYKRDTVGLQAREPLPDQTLSFGQNEVICFKRLGRFANLDVLPKIKHFKILYLILPSPYLT